MWWQHIWSLSINARISRGQLWLSDMMLRLFLVFIFFIDMALFQMPILVFVILLLVLIKTIFLMVERMNDLDLNPHRLLGVLWLIIFALLFQNFRTMLFLIVFVIAFQITLYAIPGTEGGNQYWPDPVKIQPKTNEKYYILVGIFLFFILTLWAIYTSCTGRLALVYAAQALELLCSCTLLSISVVMPV